MKILILSRYDYNGASSRFRFYQYIPFLKQEGIDVTIEPLLGGSYIKHLYDKTSLPIVEIIHGYMKRLLLLFRKKKYDIIWLQQEAFPWVPFWIEKLLFKSNIKIVTDHDDAFFHRYDLHKSAVVRFVLKKKIDSVMRSADLVLAGNDYLATRAKKNNSGNVVIFPTVVDINIFKKKNVPKNNTFTIGWIGSPGTSKYLKIIEEALKIVCKGGDVKVVLVGSDRINIDNVNLDIKEWKESTEVEEISKFDIGIMPLPDNPWERGKCGFKLIQYLSCEVPVIGSPVGVNKKIIINGVNGFHAETINEWVKYIRLLKRNVELRKQMGKSGRNLIVEKYSLQNNAVKLINFFQEMMREGI